MSVRDQFNIKSLLKSCTDVNGKLYWSTLYTIISERKFLPQDVPNLAKGLLGASLTESGCLEDEDVARRFFAFYSRYLSFAWKRSKQDVSWTRCRIPRMGSRWILQPMSSSAYPNPRIFNPEWLPDTEWIALNAGDFRFMRALVRYGAWTGKMDRQMRMLDKDFVELMVLMGDCAKKPWDEEHALRAWNSVDVSEEEDIPGKKRLHVVLRTIKAAMLFKQNDPKAERYFECLNLYFTTVSDPMVSMEEVRQVLLHFVKEDRRDTVDQIMGIWVRLFGRNPCGPRSLVHMCRITVRRALFQYKADKSCVLPELVGELPISNVTKEILLGAPERTSEWLRSTVGG